MELKELREELGKTWEILKTKNEEIEKQVKKYGEAQQELKTITDKLNNRLDQLETKLNRPNFEVKVPSQEREAFLSFLRKGTVPPEQKATFIEGTGNVGGYTVAPDYLRQLIVTTITLIDPVRQLAKVITTSSNDVKVPTVSYFADATWASDETATERTAQNAATPFGQVDIPVYELYSICDVSNDLLEDSMFDLEAEIRQSIATRIAYKEGREFIVGSGSAGPTGLLYSPAAGSVVITGVADNWPASNPADKIFDVFFTLKEPYASRGVWGLNRATLAQIRKFKDSMGNYIWSPGISDVPSTILGRPYYTFPSMPTVGAGNYILVFADWQSAYCIVDRNIMTVIRDPYTLGTYNTTRFTFRFRVGGKPLVSEAMACLKCAAS